MSDELRGLHDEKPTSPVSDPDPGVRIGMGVLEGLLGAMPESTDLQTAADRLLDAVVSLLGLSRASLELIEERAGVRILTPMSAAGEHAALARDMPARPLHSAEDAARAVATLSPVLVEDLHGIGDFADSEQGVARWRAGMSTHTYAVLPLAPPGSQDVLGILTLEWSTPHHFEAQERDTLAWMARSLAEALSSFDECAPGGVLPPTPSTPTRAIHLGFDREAGISYGDGAEPPPSPLGVTIAIAEPVGDRQAPFWDLIEMPDAAAVVIVGVAKAPALGAALFAERARQLLRASVLAAVDGAVSLTTLARWVRVTAQAGADVTAGVLRMSALTGEVVAACGDTAGFALVGTDGRISAPRRSSADTPSEWRGLAIPGDHLLLVAGGARTPAADAPAWSDLRVAREGVDASSLLRSAAGLWEADAENAASAAVIEVTRLG